MSKEELLKILNNFYISENKPLDRALLNDPVSRHYHTGFLDGLNKSIEIINDEWEESE